MTLFDYAVLLVIGFSIVVSLMRGAMREIISIIGWVLAFYTAKTYSFLLIPYMPDGIPTQAFKAMLAFVVCFSVVLFCSSLIAIAISGLVRLLGLGWLDRVLGGIIGLLRGLLIVCIFVLLAGMTDLPKNNQWVNAMLSSPFEAIVLSILPWIPESIAKHVHLGESVPHEGVV